MTPLFRHLGLLSLFSTMLLNAAPLTLDEAIAVLKQQNLEIKAAQLEAKSAHSDVSLASGYHYGTLDFTQDAVRSNDAGNVFGFKLSSREATFGDFGFNDFLTPLGIMMGGGTVDQQQLLATQPHDLNYPDYQNFFQSKLTYMLPLYTGGKISSYTTMAKEMEAIKQLDSTKVTDEKIYELRKSYYDMALLEHSIGQLKIIQKNITILHTTTQQMVKEGYAKKVDLLEVESKKANIDRLIAQMEGNKKLNLHYLSFLLDQEIKEITVPTDDRATTTLTQSDILASNSDIQKTQHALELRASMIDAANAPLLPTVGAFAQASTADNAFLGDFSDHAAYTVGAKLSWNLFNGGIDTANIEKSRIEHLKTSTQAQLAKKGIALQYDKITTEIANLDVQIVSLEKELELSTQIYRNYEGRYKEHLSSMSDLLIKQSMQIEQIINLQAVKNQRNERIFALEKLHNGDTK